MLSKASTISVLVQLSFGPGVARVVATAFATAFVNHTLLKLPSVASPLALNSNIDFDNALQVIVTDVNQLIP